MPISLKRSRFISTHWPPTWSRKACLSTTPGRRPTVVWSHGAPRVQFQGAWLELVSINNTSTEAIIEHCRKTYDHRWQKRFDEDLYEVLKGMDRLPEGMYVHLVLRDPKTGERSVHEKVEMTFDKRRALYQRRTLESVRGVSRC